MSFLKLKQSELVTLAMQAGVRVVMQGEGPYYDVLAIPKKGHRLSDPGEYELQSRTPEGEQFLAKLRDEFSVCCGVPYSWRGIGGIRLWTDIKGRKVYRASCPSCMKDYEIDGGSSKHD